MRIHFIAIGGSAMHNLALALHVKGDVVTGSDDEIFEPSQSRLKERGLLPERLGWDESRINEQIDAIILGMHARSDNPELLKAQQLGLKIYSYPEFLFEQSKNKRRLVIAGSHGKTTITSMILHVLKHAGIEADYMVGAQLEGFDIMVRLSEQASWMVMEGDEYLTSPIDRRPKFLHYHPHIAVLSGIGWDHVNVFPDFDMYLDQFRQLIDHLPLEGKLIYFDQDEHVKRLASSFSGVLIPYSYHHHSVKEGVTYLHDAEDQKFPIRIFGQHNLANVQAAYCACKEMGVADADFYEAISGFGGASKRLELLAEKDGNFLFRDFAHAPSKLKATVAALRERFPLHKLVICFELHTYSSMSESFIDHYKDTISSADAIAIFYDPHAVAIKRLQQMSDLRIAEGFGRQLHVLHDVRALEDFLQDELERQTVIALMSSGSFGGVDLKKLQKSLGL